MSRGAKNSSHVYRGRRIGRGARLASKLGYAVTLQRLEQLLQQASRLVARAREGQR